MHHRPLPPKFRSACAGRTPRPRRRGAVTLELILTLPIWLIFLLAIIEFGQILAGQQQVALASRVGAEEASQTPDLPWQDGSPVPPNVLRAIDQQLASAGITGGQVRLQHNVVPSPPPVVPVPVTLSTGGRDCDPAVTELPAVRRYVRLTVGVPLEGLAPNLLATFGFDIAPRIIQHTTTFRYEL